MRTCLPACLRIAAPLTVALGLNAPLSAQLSSDQWASPVVLRMSNPDFPNPNPPGDDYFSPIHATLGPGGHLMLFGYRQDRPQIQSAPNIRRTGSMAAILLKDHLSSPPSGGEVTLESLGEHRDISCGVRVATPNQGPGTAEYVESDPNDLGKKIFADRLFCSGHTVLGDGTVFAIGGLRASSNGTTARGS